MQYFNTQADMHSQTYSFACLSCSQNHFVQQVLFYNNQLHVAPVAISYSQPDLEASIKNYPITSVNPWVKEMLSVSASLILSFGLAAVFQPPKGLSHHVGLFVIYFTGLVALLLCGVLLLLIRHFIAKRPWMPAIAKKMMLATCILMLFVIIFGVYAVVTY